MDLIDRHAVINTIYRRADADGYVCYKVEEMEEIINALPSVQPDYRLDEWCTDCSEYDHEKHCCPRWNRVIRNTLKDVQADRADIWDKLSKVYNMDDVPDAAKSIIGDVMLEAQPERKKGKWHKPSGMMPPEYAGVYRCSNCDELAMRDWKHHRQTLTNFCPNCGARMEEQG